MAGYRQQQEKIKILFVAADPLASRKLDEEMRDIAQKILLTDYRDLLTMVYTLAARPDDLLQALNQYRPQIVHFSGKGGPDGEILLLDQNRQAKPVHASTLKALFEVLKDNIRVVVFNTCYSHIQAEAVTHVIDCAIGMDQRVNDEASITFASAFYRAIGFGCTLSEAFDQGRVALQLANIAGHHTLQMRARAGVDLSRIRLIVPEEYKIVEPKSNSNRFKDIHDALIHGDYATAYHDIDHMVRAAYNTMLSQERAKLKYLEALVYLEGKRPFSQSPSVIQAVERVMNIARKMHPLYSYTGALAIFKCDFARAGLRKYGREGEQLFLEAQKLLPLKSADRENVDLLAKIQPHLYRDNCHRLQL